MFIVSELFVTLFKIIYSCETDKCDVQSADAIVSRKYVTDMVFTDT